DRAGRADRPRFSTVRAGILAAGAPPPHCGRDRRAWATIRPMPPALAPMLPPRRANRMLLLVFGTGAAIGLQLGVLHVFLWRSWFALVTFVGSSLVFAALTYALWRWIFPRLGGRSFAGRVALQTLVSFVVFAALSFLTT